MELQGEKLPSLESRENRLKKCTGLWDTRKIILKDLTVGSLTFQKERRKKMGLKKYSKKNGSKIS